MIPSTHNDVVVTSIGKEAFLNKSKILELIIKDTCTTVGERAFNKCNNIKSIAVPISLKLSANGTDYQMFLGCTGIKKVHFTKGINNGKAFDYYYTGSSEQTFYGYTPWYISRTNEITVTFEEGITSIGKYMFYECTGLKGEDFSLFPESLISIGEKGFYKCINLKGTFDTKKIPSIPSNVFEGCTGIEELIIQEKCTSIGVDAFKGCSNIKSITVPISLNLSANGSTYQMFSGCTGINRVHFTKGINNGKAFDYYHTSQSGQTYYGYTPWYVSKANEITVTFEDGITYIGNYMFYECTGLKVINYKNKQYTNLSDFQTAFSANNGTISSTAFTGCSI